ncbi:MAG: nucleotide exchange factor GrpE [Gammaproteobacteria bacterium]
MRVEHLDEEFKQQLISEFSEYLDAGAFLAGAADEGERPVDLYSLLQEFVALKTEVKIEARQFKSALDQFQATLDQLRTEKTYLGECLEQTKAGIQQEKDNALRALLVSLLDLRDRLHAGLQAVEQVPEPRISLCRRKRDRALIEGLRKGQSLTLKRLDDLLASYQVVPIAVLDKVFDPMAMRAAEVETREDLENGRVTGELRIGYRWRNEVLRVAEVKVNKVE